LYLCIYYVDFFYLKDYGIFASIFGVHSPNFFTVQGNAIVCTLPWGRYYMR